MKIEDCKVGIKVKNCWDGKIEKRDKKGIISNIGSDYINFKGRGDIKFYPEYFEPANKFEVGDKVLYKAENSRNYKCTIFGIAKQKDKFDGKYAISFVKGSGRVVNKIVKEYKLSQLKKKDELKVGDKFIRDCGLNERKTKVLARVKKRGTVYYLCESLDDGFIDCWSENNVKEIIYD